MRWELFVNTKESCVLLGEITVIQQTSYRPLVWFVSLDSKYQTNTDAVYKKDS